MKIKPWLILLVGLFLLTAGLVIGAQWYRLNLFPFPQLHEWKYPPEKRVPKSNKMITVNYSTETPVFSDRLYFDTIGDERLEVLSLVQIPRHHKDDINIEAYRPITVYRLISDDNDNSPFESWSHTDIPINVRGFTTTHTRVVKKDFPAGTITLNPGGPIASSPILIKVHGYSAPNYEFEVLEGARSTH